MSLLSADPLECPALWSERATADCRRKRSAGIIGVTHTDTVEDESQADAQIRNLCRLLRGGRMEGLGKGGKSERPSRGDAGVPNLPGAPPAFSQRSSSDGTSGSVPSTPLESERLRLGGKRPGAEVRLKERGGGRGGKPTDVPHIPSPSFSSLLPPSLRSLADKTSLLVPPPRSPSPPLSLSLSPSCLPCLSRPPPGQDVRAGETGSIADGR